MPFANGLLLQPGQPATEPQVPKCDCRCGLLTVGVAAVCKEHLYQKTGYGEIDSSGNSTYGGRVYRRKTRTIADNGLPDDTPPIPGVTQITIWDYDPATNGDTLVSNNYYPYGGETVGTTFTLSKEYTDEAFLADSLSAFADLSFPDPALDENGYVTNLSYLLGEAIAFRTEHSVAGFYPYTPTNYQYFNVAGKPLNYAKFRSMKYVLVVRFALPWLDNGTNKIGVQWTERHTTYSGSSKLTPPSPPVITETGDMPTITEKSATLTVAAGAKYVATDVFTHEASDLAAGDTVFLSGPVATAELLIAVSRTAIYYGAPAVLRNGNFAAQGYKIGFPPYFLASAVPAVPVYLRQTASGMPPGGGAGYGGAMVWNPDIGEDGEFSDGFVNVPSDYHFTGRHSESFDDPDALDSVTRGTNLTPTTIRFGNGLNLALSQEMTTAQLIARVRDFIQDLNDGNTDPEDRRGGCSSYGSEGVAERYLPPDERSYREYEGSWYLDVWLPGTQSNITSQFVQPAVKTFSGGVTLTYQRVTTDLDTGGRSSQTRTFTISFDTSQDPVWDVSGTEADSEDRQTETVPATNQRVSVRGVKFGGVVGGKWIDLPIFAQITQ